MKIYKITYFLKFLTFVLFLGLNNIKANDYMNVILQALSHVEGLR